MKKLLTKRVLIIVSALLVLIVGGVTAYLIWGKQEPPPPPPEPIVDKVVTIKELKEKYNYKDNKISPLYNVSPKEQFKISFNSYLGDIPASEVITVHTHDSLDTGSIIDTELVPETFEVGPSTFTIKPKESVLNKVTNSWGIHHKYYIKVNYDLDANTPTRLEHPLVIPFTIKGTAENVEAQPVITNKGVFQLTWKPFQKDSTSVQVYNIVKSTESQYESDKTPVEANAFVSTFTRNIGGNAGGLFTDWLSKNSASGVAEPVTSPILNLNDGLKGAYYLQNLNGDKSSVVSNIVNTSEYANRIPTQLITPISTSVHDTIRSLPKTVQVQMLDGSISDQFVHYQTDGVKAEEGTPTAIQFTIANTSYKGLVTVTQMKQEELDVIKQGELVNLTSSYHKPINLTSVKPSINVPTLISDARIITDAQDKEKVDEGKTEEATAPNNTSTATKEENAPNDTTSTPKSSTETKTEENKSGALGLGGTTAEGSPEEVKEDPTVSMGIVNKQYYYNQQLLETANEQTITIPAYLQEAGYELTHASALEEYVAYSLLAKQPTISLDAFPDAQEYSVVSDAVEKILTQNPLLNNVSEWKYDYLTRSINFTYNTDFSPSDLLSQAQTILEELTMEDAVLTKKELKDGVAPYKVKKKLSTQELYQTVYDYLIDNIKLTTLEEAKNPSDSKEEPKKDEPTGKDTSQADDKLPELTGKPTAYHALSEGVADDLGFAKAFKLLMDISDIPTIVVTGYYQGEPHAWNKVSLEDTWYNVDTTLTSYTLGIPNALALASDDTAKSLGYLEDRGYWLDAQLSVFSATSGALDYYVANGLEVDTVGDYAKVLESQLQNGNRVSVIRTRLELDPKLIFDTTGLVVQQTVPDKLSTATFNSKGKYYMVVTHEEEEVEDVPEDVSEGGKTTEDSKEASTETSNTETTNE